MSITIIVIVIEDREDDIIVMVDRCGNKPQKRERPRNDGKGISMNSYTVCPSNQLRYLRNFRGDASFLAARIVFWREK
jgi:hypothetical protein